MHIKEVNTVIRTALKTSRMYTADSDKANILNDQFASVFTREDTVFLVYLSCNGTNKKWC